MTAIALVSYGLEHLHLLSVQFELIADAPVFLPEFSGSAFRGIFGHTLKDIACHQGCSPNTPCTYHYLFETSEQGSTDEVARPYVLEPPTLGRVIPPGQTFSLGFQLIGRGTQHLLVLIQAVERMGRLGIGERHNRFRLDRIAYLSATGMRWFYRTDRTGPQRILEEPIARPVTELVQLAPSACKVACSFETPLRLVHRGELAREPHFHVLVRSLLRRLDNLLKVHEEQSLQADFRELVAKAQSIETISNTTRWYDWERRSNRQGQAMRLGGMVGRTEYAGDLTPFLPLLAAGSLVHVGKATTFGLGKYRVETTP